MFRERWDYPKQTLCTPDVPGDCWRCCIAAILHLPFEKVPHFVHQMKLEDTDSIDLTALWLAKRGMWLIEVCMATPRQQYARLGLDQSMPIIVTGPSPRSQHKGAHHAVVVVDGTMMYDPHPSEAGLTADLYRYLIVPMHLPPLES